jgi:hypothetical protein
VVFTYSESTRPEMKNASKSPSLCFDFADLLLCLCLLLLHTCYLLLCFTHFFLHQCLLPRIHLYKNYRCHALSPSLSSFLYEIIVNNHPYKVLYAYCLLVIILPGRGILDLIPRALLTTLLLLCSVLAFLALPYRGCV